MRVQDTFNHILVMGAGAVGGYFGGRIAEEGSSEVSLVARGDHLAAIKKNGLEIMSPSGDCILEIPAFRDPADAPPPDLVLFTVKSFDTDQAIEQLKPAMKPYTQILALQNGITNYGKLREQFGAERVIQGFCRIGASILKPGVIDHSALGTVVAGEEDGRLSDRMNGLKELFDGTGITFQVSDDILHEVWVKYAWNSIFNMLTVAAGVTVDGLFKHEATEALCADLFDEIQELAGAEGIDLTEEDKCRIIDNSKELTGFTTSTYMDLKRGKRLEIETFTGEIVRLAKKHSLNLPKNEALYGILKAIELKEKPYNF